ncbi:MAG: cora3 [Chlamydiales bacterium]|jgi:magnesium transporter|nr:cora3 [Chlamydiales bacterium]
MLYYFRLTAQGVQPLEQSLHSCINGQDPIWIDMLNPSREEEELVESLLKIDIPTLEEMQRIDDSSRFYTRNHTLFMTGFVSNKDSYSPLKTEILSLVVNANYLITVRYVELHTFHIFKYKLKTIEPQHIDTVDKLALGIIETISDDISEGLRKTKSCLEHITSTIFEDEDLKIGETNLKKMIQIIGRTDSQMSKLHEDIVSLARMLNFLSQTEVLRLSKDSLLRIKTIENDLRSMKEYSTLLNSTTNFLLQANLGFISIQQNKIIKAFTVAAVLFLPPTLVGTIYGMNFRYMPELEWVFGYPFAVVLMVLSCWGPYVFLKKRGWL